MKYDPTTAADVLDRAADLIVERGWAKNEWVSDEGCLCAAAAIYVACNRTPKGHRARMPAGHDYRADVAAYQSAGWHLAREVKRGEFRLAEQAWPGAVRDILTRWNDQWGQTYFGVIVTMRHRAKQLRVLGS